MALSSRLAIIAGGFGGLGYAIGLRLQAHGARLALLYAPPEASREQSIRQAYRREGTGDDFDTYECDITSPESVDTAFAGISKAVNNASPAGAVTPTILINAAGYVSLNPFESTPVAETMKHLHINILGPILVSQAFTRLYLEMAPKAAQISKGLPKPGGRIVTIASQAAHVALPDHAPYCASKAALLGLTRAMAYELGPKGITANTISPGPVMTEMGKKAWADDDYRNGYLATVPVRRFAEPHEIAASIEYLCSDEAGTVNGTDIGLDGGYVIS